MDRVLKIEIRRDGREIVGVVIHIVPVAVCVERPCPRRSWAITRYPCNRKNIICVSQSSAESGQPWLKTSGWPDPQSLK